MKKILGIVAILGIAIIIAIHVKVKSTIFIRSN